MGLVEGLGEVVSITCLVDYLTHCEQQQPTEIAFAETVTVKLHHSQ